MARRLPVLQSNPSDGDADERPPWHWSAIGGVLTFLVWLPLAMLGGVVTKALVAALVPGEGGGDVGAFLAAHPERRLVVVVAVVAPQVLFFAVAAAAAGALVAHFGGRAGPREAAVGGIGAALVAWILTATESGFGASTYLLPPAVLVGGIAAWLGGRWGAARKR